jgi:FkbM family methyltransferase
MELPRTLRPLTRLKVLKVQVFEKLDTLLGRTAALEARTEDLMSTTETVARATRSALDDDTAIMVRLVENLRALHAQRVTDQHRLEQLTDQVQSLQAEIERLSDRAVGLSTQVEAVSVGLDECSSRMVGLDGRVARLFPRLDVRGSLPSRITVDGVLLHARQLGFAPRTVIEIGAGSGDFSRLCAALFPEAQILVFEPLPEYGPGLEQLAADGRRVTFQALVLGARPGTRMIAPVSEGRGAVGSLEPDERSEPFPASAALPVTTLDAEREARQLEAPVLLKVDGRGDELDILAGAKATLVECGMLILRASLFQSRPKAPLVHDVVAAMAENGFCISDVADIHRSHDGALAQVDIAFVPGDSPLRREETVASPGTPLGPFPSASG